METKDKLSRGSIQMKLKQGYWKMPVENSMPKGVETKWISDPYIDDQTDVNMLAVIMCNWRMCDMPNKQIYSYERMSRQHRSNKWQLTQFLCNWSCLGNTTVIQK